MKSNNIGYSIIYSIIVFIIINSIMAVSTLALGIFSPKEVTLLSLVISCLSLYYFKGSISETKQLVPNWQLLVFILLTALCFRAEPFYWIYGGQDQGIYTNMSAHFQREGKVFYDDIFEPQNKALEDLYHDNLWFKEYQPGVYYQNKEYVFQFYHLHPLWMAIFADFFGDTARFYALTFFSLLSIVGIFLLTFELTKSSWAASTAGFLIAFNPLHAFFSKWPVTEVVALAFTSLGLFLFLHVINLTIEKKIKKPQFLTVLSALCFSMYFFTRISGFIFLPFLFFLLSLGIYLYKTSKKKYGNITLLFSGVTIIAYSLSILYGLIYSYPYSSDIYNITFSKLLGSTPQISGGILVLGILLYFSATLILPKSKYALIKAHEHSLIKNLIRIIWSFIIIVYIFSLYKFIVRFFLTPDKIIDYNYFSKNILLSCPINWLLYSSPFLVLFSLIYFRKVKKNIFLLISSVFLMPPLIYVFYLNPIVWYQYYYSRYLLSEAVPYFIIFAVYILFEVDVKTIYKRSVLFSSLAFFSYFSFAQLGIREGEKNYDVLSEISENLNEEDIILLNYDGWKTHPSLFQTPLKFYFDENIIGFKEKELDSILNNIKNPSGDIFILSPNKIYSNLLELTDYKKYTTFDHIIERKTTIPTKKVELYYYEQLYLYKVPSSLYSFVKEEAIVKELFLKYLNRVPSLNNVISWVEGLKKETLSKSFVEEQIILSKEYFDSNLKDKKPEQVITILFGHIYQQKITPQQKEMYLNLFNKTSSIQHVVQQMLNNKHRITPS